MKKFSRITKWFSIEEDGREYEDRIDELIDISGYSYDPRQDIYYSNIDAWQRNMGYCRLYDEAAAPLGMIVDCEPIYFQYDNRRWLIEFWKGQYDLTTGCEVGVYVTEGPDLNIPGFFNGTFYKCVSDEEMLNMACILKKNNRVVFKRQEKHWWITGFKLGMYSEPWELTMYIKIELKDEEMTNAFLKGLKEANYKNDQVIRNGNVVILEYNSPKLPQPYTRTVETDKLMQMKNKKLCDSYQYFVNNFPNMEDRMYAIREQSPELYEKISSMGRVRKFINIYGTIEKYLGKKE
ncbi:DUF4474 domain-containing protein [Clostridium sp. D2Q-14]|nr:DUF4474 domain-containing protein [Anaeromonas gelatinilytica]